MCRLRRSFRGLVPVLGEGITLSAPSPYNTVLKGLRGWLRVMVA